ncbi:MAG: hypothetical protein KGM42_02495 [Hyphomicrobiales bacterium]|nr:hypothetical protein [Hyphomicrobiales bacterium]
MLRAHRRAHRLAWTALAVLIPLVLVVALMSRPTAQLPAPERLSNTRGAS